jgi:HPt (histidine-containing phosphotransfer) domain-containing protein
LLRAGERKQAQRMAHTLKGTSATVGALALSAQALRLEREIADPDSRLEALDGMSEFRQAIQQAAIALESAHAAMATPTL